MDYYSIDLSCFKLHLMIHEFLKKRISNIFRIQAKTFPPILKSLFTGPTLSENITYL